MHGSPIDLVSFWILLGGALAMPVLSGYFRVPSAVLLIGFGVLVGPSALNLVPHGDVVPFLYQVGFIVLLFLAGLEIDFNGIRHRGRSALLKAAALSIAILILALGLGHLLGLHPIYGLALGAISVGLPLAVLKETGLLRTPLGQQIILVSSLGEFFTLVGMTLIFFGSRYGLSVELVIGLGRLLAVLLIAGTTLRVFVALAWWRPSGFSRFVESDDGSEIGVRASLFLMMTFSILAILAGVESIIGAFLAGTLIAFVLRGKEVLEEKLAVVGHGLFVPIFFVLVGVDFNPSVIAPNNLVMAAELLLVVFGVRLIPCLPLLKEGLTMREMLGTASLLSAPLTLMVAIGALGRELQVLDQAEHSTIIVLAVVTGALFPVLFRHLASPSSPPA